MSSQQENTLRDWIALSFVTGIGSRTAAALIDQFGSPAALFDGSVHSLELAGLRRESIDEIKDRTIREKAEREVGRLAELGGEALTLRDERYPPLLRETYDPPIVIYCMGDITAAITQPVVAIVGSRRCSTYGRNVAEKLSRELSQRGVTVVSGLARGIDSAAHRGALDGRGLTIGVMGTGLDAVYPKENRKLAARIAEQGALLTEFSLGTPPTSQNFPFRNRVISGLALGVMVVEGAERSGSLITARLAYEQGRDVFAVPGNITSAKSFGPNYLLKDGAKLVQTWRDVVEEMPAECRSAILTSERGETVERKGVVTAENEMTDIERKVLKMLSTDDPLHIDLMIARAGLGPGDLMGVLLKLEMSDRIRQLPGKCFVRTL